MLQNERLSKTLLNNLRQCLHRLRLVVQDLMPVVRQHYAHLAMVNSTGGMFSIKTVRTMLIARLSHDQMEGVQNGTETQPAYLRAAALEAVGREGGYTGAQREREIRSLLLYCKMDGVAIAGFFELLSVIIFDLIKEAENNDHRKTN